jgi:hypothetical protein
MEEEEQKTLPPEKVSEAFAAAEQEAARIQQAHLEAAQHAGYARAAIHAMAPFYVEAAKLSEDLPQVIPFVASGVKLVDSLADELGNLYTQVAPILPQAHSISGSVVTLVTSTSATSDIFLPGVVDLEPFEAPPFFAPDENATYDVLQKIDPPLAETYREVGQTLHGTTADPARAAIASMRQTLDHFFAKLAPDDDVRASPYWKPKYGPDPYQITRRERMTYAAHTHIKDLTRAKTIIDSIDVVLEAYQFLHQLHKRGALSEKQANRALKTTKAFIESWTEALSQ